MQSAVALPATGTARERVRHSLNEFLALTRELFESITRMATGVEPRRSPPEVVVALLQNDAKLCAACEDLEKMTHFELKIRRFKARMRQEDKVVEELLAVLKNVEGQLYDAIEAVKPVGDAHRTAKAQPVDLTDLMYVARNVSYTTRARQGFQPGMPMKGYLRPYPLPAEMCCGWLMHECITAAAPQIGPDTSVTIDQAANRGGQAQPSTAPHSAPDLAAGIQQASARKRARDDNLENGAEALSAKRPASVKEQAAIDSAGTTSVVGEAAAASSFDLAVAAPVGDTEAEAATAGSNEAEDEESEDDDDDGLEWE